jgi:hypothetical protein
MYINKIGELHYFYGFHFFKTAFIVALVSGAFVGCNTSNDSLSSGSDPSSNNIAE